MKVAEVTILPRKVYLVSPQNHTGAVALVEASMPPHPKFPPILTLNMGIPTGWTGVS